MQIKIIFHELKILLKFMQMLYNAKLSTEWKNLGCKEIKPREIFLSVKSLAEYNFNAGASTLF